MDKIQIEVAYALPHQQTVIPMTVDAGTTVEQAIEQSNILTRHPEIDLTIQKVGIFGEIVPLDTRVEEGDRVEIYRPLLIDPKEARRNRVKKQKGK